MQEMQEVRVWFLLWEDPLEEEMTTHSGSLAWNIPLTEESGRLQSMELQRIGRDGVIEHAWTRVTLSVIQWLQVRLPMQGTGVQSRVREDPTLCNAIKPTCHNCWACTLEPVFHNKRCHHNEKSVHLKEEEPLLTTIRESLHTAAKTQFSQEKEKKTRWETFSTQYLI